MIFKLYLKKVTTAIVFENNEIRTKCIQHYDNYIFENTEKRLD